MSKNQESDFTQMIDAAMDRRDFLKRSAALGMGSFLAASPLSEAVAKAITSSSLLNFEAIPVSVTDEVTVPKGYKAEPLISWGDPIFNGAPEFDPSGKAPSAAQELQFGDNTDGMSLFTINDSRAVLAINNEYINTKLMFDHAVKAMRLRPPS